VQVIALASSSPTAPPDRAVTEFKMSQPVVVLDVPVISNAKPRERYGNVLMSLIIAVPLSCVLWLGIFRLLRAVFH
jgi:hypothetical protein